MFASQGMVSAAKNADRKNELFIKESLLCKQEAEKSGDYTKLRKMLIGNLVESIIILVIITSFSVAAFVLKADFKVHPIQSPLKVLSALLAFGASFAFLVPTVFSIVRDINGLRWVRQQTRIIKV